MSYKKIYLAIPPLRRGTSLLYYVTRERCCSTDPFHYMLGTYYHRIPKTGKDFSPYKGIGKEYGACMKTTISKELYDAFIKEAKKKHKEWKESGKGFRKCRKCGAQKRVGKPCVICAEIKKRSK